MHATSLLRPEELVMTMLPEPPLPAPGEALVKVLRVGICGTDLHAFKGEQPMMHYPVVLGHELAVEVLVLGAQSEAGGPQVGDRCTVVPYLDCGRCGACAQGLTNCCENLKVLGVHVDGGLRERFVLPTRLLIAADGLDDDQLALTEMLAIGTHAVERARLMSNENVVVIGLGPIGLGIVAAAIEVGVNAIGIDVSSSRRAFLEGTGMAPSLEAGAAIPDQLRAAFGGELPSAVFDATGNATSMQNAPQLAAPGGRVVLVGHTPGLLSFDNQTIHRKELSIMASRNATRADFERVMARLRLSVNDPRRWINARTDLPGLVTELAGWAGGRGGVVKAIVHLA